MLGARVPIAGGLVNGVPGGAAAGGGAIQLLLETPRHGAGGARNVATLRALRRPGRAAP